MATKQAVNNTRATTPVSVPEITRIQVEGNDTVSFLYGLTPPYQYVRGMSQIMTQNPAYISYRYDTITISQVAGESFTFTIYSITDVGGNTFTALTSLDTSDVVAAKTQEIYRLLVTSVFKGCCECGNTEPECSIQYTAGNGSDAGTFLYDSGGSVIRVNNFTANNQDFSGFWPIIQDGSWIFVFSKTDPTVYGVYQLSNYSDGGPGVFAQFDAALLNGPGEFPEGTSLCVDVTSVGGSLVQDWQDTLNISSLLTQDNTVDGGGFNFAWGNVNRYTIDSISYQAYTADDGAGSIGIVQIDPGAVTISGTSFIDIITPNYGAATAGMVLALDGSGHVEYTTAGTGTVVSVGLTMPSAFTVSNSPITISGDIGVVGAGTDLEYINGLGELATLPVYTVENGLHVFGSEPGETPANPFLFHLGGLLVEDTVITTTNGSTEYVLGVSGTANQDTRRPFSASNLGQGGTAVFSDFGSGARPNPTVEIFGNTDTYRPLLELELNGPLPNPGGPGIWENRNSFLSLRNTGTTSVGARMAIDYTFRNTSVSPSPDLYLWPAVKLIAEATNVTENAETSNFSIRMFDGGSQQDKLLLEGNGQLTLNEYGAGTFIDNALTYVLAVDSTGQVWKKEAEGGGTVLEVDTEGLITGGPITTTGTITTSMATSRLVGRWDTGTGIMQEIVIGSGLTLTGDTLTADGGTGFDVQVNDTTIIPPATILNLKSGTDIDVVYEGSGAVRFDWAGTPSTQGLQDVIIEDNVLTQNNTIEGSLTSFVWKSNSFYEINPTVNYDPGTGTVPGYFKAFVGKYPPSYSELYVEAIYAQMKSQGATNQIVKVDTTGVYIQTPGLGSATVGQVLTLQNATTGQVEYQDAGGGTYTVNNGLIEDPTDNFQLGGPLVEDTTITGGTTPFSHSLSLSQLTQFNVTASNKSSIHIEPSGASEYAEMALTPTESSIEYSSLTTAYQASFTAQGATGDNSKAVMNASTPYGQVSVITEGNVTDGFNQLRIITPNVHIGSALVGQVLTLKSITGSGAGRVEFEDAVGATYTVNNGLSPDPSDPDIFQLGGPLIADTSISGDGNTYSLTFDDMDVLSGSSNFKIAFAVNDGTTTSSFALQPNIASIGCAVNGSGSASFAEFTDTQSRIGYLTPTQVVQFGADATGLYVLTPGVDAATATVGQVLTLINATTGESEWADGGGGGGGGRSYYLNGSINQGTFAGIAMKEMSPVPISGAGTNFVINADGYIASFITDAGDPNKVLIPAGNWNFELWFGANSGGGSPNFYVELSKYDTVGGTFTPIASGVGAPEGITGGAVVDLYFTALSVPQTTLALTDRLAVRVWVNHSGRTITLYTEDNRFSQVITSFPSGIASLNGLTAFAQSLAVGTAGTDFDISSSVATHTFNLPTASATNRGALSNTDWSRFDSFKTQTIGATVDGSGGVITAGIKGYVQIPYACTINSWRIITNTTANGTISFDIYRATSGIIPTASIIGGGVKPSLTSFGLTQTTASASLGTWTSTALAANDMLAFNVESGVTTFSWAILQLFVTKT
jgi:hypothetical protein